MGVVNAKTMTSGTRLFISASEVEPKPSASGETPGGPTTYPAG